MMSRRAFAVVTALYATAAGGGTAPAADIAEPDGYRTSEYRAPVPHTLRGAAVVGVGDAEAIWRRGEAIFVDVLPRPPRPANLPAGTVWRDRPRFDIPGSIWLPDTGYGELAAVTRKYFVDGLASATAGDQGKLLVFYCQKDCWMSWNAAKRAVEIGYTRVIWYPEGTDGWDAAGLPLVEAQPYAQE
jgi:PQQ-dependent catabolism-associated CXXCW motif protein